MSARYALYFAPEPAGALWRTGSALLGYDAVSGLAPSLLVPAGWTDADWHAATDDPRRYGFHATLKAPFRLAEGCGEGDLLDAVAAFALPRKPVDMGAMAVAALGSFLAFVPTAPGPALEAFAGEVVTAFERFRAPLTEAERARRKPDRLSARQRDLLDRYGYPHVLELFRFHMTLSGSLPAERIGPTRDALQAALDGAGVAPRLVLDRIAVFRQADPASRFTVLRAFDLAG